MDFIFSSCGLGRQLCLLCCQLITEVTEGALIPECCVHSSQNAVLIHPRILCILIPECYVHSSQNAVRGAGRDEGQGLHLVSQLVLLLLLLTCVWSWERLKGPGFGCASVCDVSSGGHLHHVTRGETEAKKAEELFFCTLWDTTIASTFLPRGLCTCSSTSAILAPKLHGAAYQSSLAA